MLILSLAINILCLLFQLTEIFYLQMKFPSTSLNAYYITWWNGVFFQNHKVAPKLLKCMVSALSLTRELDKNKQTKHTTTRMYCIYTHKRVNVVSLNGLTAADQGWMARETSWELRPWCSSIFVPELITHSLTYSLWHMKDHLTSSNPPKDQVLHCALFSVENINIGRREYHQILFKATIEKLARPYFQTQAIQI